MGMELTQDLVIKTPDEADVAIMTEPTEVTTRTLAIMGQRTALKRNVETREIFRGIKEIEPARGTRQYKGALEVDI